MITKNCIAEIEAAARIEEVVSDFVPLKRQGKDWVGVCPFHDDKNPSMHVSPRLGIYKCFVCDAGGGPINFVMNHEKTSYPEALRYLAQKYHIEIEEIKKELSPEEKAAYDEREALLNVTSYAEKYFIDQLFNSEEGREIGLTYFKERGFREETIRKFKLGYCPEGWDKFTVNALENGYKLDYLLETGLTKKSESGKLHDFYHGRVIFPIHNGIGKAVGFGGRILAKAKTDKIAKYFNSPESSIYHKSDILYGFFFAKKSIRVNDNVYLVEGYTDVISMSEAGVENVVASSGTALTDGQIRLIKAQTSNITVLYDGDAAGIKASLRGINMLVAAGLNVKACLLPDGEDPDSFAKSHRDSELREYIDNHSVSIINFKAGILLKEAGNDPIKRANVVSNILETIAEVPDEIKRSFYVKECADIFKLSEESLNVSLRQLVWKKMNDRKSQVNQPQQPQNQGDTQQPLPPLPPASGENKLPHQPAPNVNTLEYAERMLVRHILKYGTYLTYEQREEGANPVPIRVDQLIFNELAQEGITFKTPIFSRVCEEYVHIASEADTPDVIEQQLVKHDEKEIAAFATAILMEEEPEYSSHWAKKFDVFTNSTKNSMESLNTETENCLNLLKLRIVEQQKKLLDKELTYPHSDKEFSDILKRYTELDQKRRELALMLRLVISNNDTTN